jgi:type I restriction enzyme S subunit
LYYLLVTLKRSLVERAVGSTFLEVGKRDIASIVIRLPQIAEQRAIAQVLSDVDGLLEALDSLIAKKHTMKQAAMQQLLSGKTRLPGRGGEWEAVEVDGIGSLYGGLTGKAKVDFGQGSARYVTFLSILENTILNAMHTDFVHVAPSEAQNAVRQGDLLFNGTSETPDDLAMGAVVGAPIEHLYLNSFCFGLRIRDKKKHDPLFLAYLFRSPTGRNTVKALAQGATRYNMSKSQFRKLQIGVPVLSEQQAVAKVLSDMDSEIAALERRRDKYRDIKEGMLQQLLSGRVRLVKPE